MDINNIITPKQHKEHCFKNIEFCGGAICDEVGLGKTLSIISHLVFKLKHDMLKFSNYKKEMNDLNISSGVKITSLDYGKFKSRGFYEGIIITKVNNKPVYTPKELVEILNNTEDGVLLEVVHENGKKNVKKTVNKTVYI